MSRAERIRRGVAKYLREHPTVTIDGEEFTVVDIQLSNADQYPLRGLTTAELMAAQGVPPRHKAYWDTLVAQRPLDTNDFNPPNVPIFIEDLMPDQKTLQSIPRVTLEEAMRANNLRTYLEFEALDQGTENQRERYAAGLLPEDELLHLARAVLFKGFGDIRDASGAELRRWAKRDHRALGAQLKHLGHTPRILGAQHGIVQREGVELETCDVGELGPDEWDILKQIQAHAEAAKLHPWLADRCGGAVEVTSSTHWATCKVCGTEACRSSAKVTITWAGRQLVREWALSPKEAW